MMKKFTLLALFATLLCFSLKAQNLLADFNPGFEGFSDTDPAYWWNTQIDTSGKARGKITFTTVNPKEGLKCARAEVTTINPGTQWHVQMLQFSQFAPLKVLKPASTDTQFYTIRFWARAATAGSKFNVVIQQGAPNYETPFEATVTTTTGWVQYSYDFKVPKDADYHPAFHFGLEVGTYFVDLVEYGKKGTLDNVAAIPKNVLEPYNPEFESYSVAAPFPSWFTQVDTASGTARGSITNVTTSPQKGARCLKADVTAVSDKPFHVQIQNTPFAQFTKLKTGTTTDQSYTLAFWAKADVAGKKINALIQNAAFGTVAVPAEQNMTLTTTWAQYVYKFTVSKDDLLRPVVHLGLEKGVYFLDNFELGKSEDIVTTTTLPKNLMESNNPEFETYSVADPFPSWFMQVDTSGTARGNISNVTTSPQKGLRCLKVDVTAVSTLPYNIQAVHNPFYQFTKLKAGATTDQDYRLTFWAKADIAGKKILAMVQNKDYATSADSENKTITLTASWAQYTYNFKVKKDDLMHPVLHMGVEKGTYYIDNFELGKAEDVVSGSKDIVITNNVLVYPNPTSGLFQIQSQEAFESLEVYDLTGKMVQKFKGNPSNQYNVSELPNGIYQLAARSKDAISVSRIVKM
jgi:Secretion system C-terminal sorting domain